MGNGKKGEKKAWFPWAHPPRLARLEKSPRSGDRRTVYFAPGREADERRKKQIPVRKKKEKALSFASKEKDAPR